MDAKMFGDLIDDRTCVVIGEQDSQESDDRKALDLDVKIGRFWTQCHDGE